MAWVALAACLFVPARALAAAPPEGLTIVFKTTTDEGEKTSTHYYSSSRVRFDEGDAEIIVDLAEGRVVHVSNKKRQYSETTFGEIEQAMSSTSAEMERAMAGVPSSLRAKMMGDAAKEVTLTKGAIRSVAGVTCQEFTVALSERTSIEACVAASIALPFDPKHLRDLAVLTAPFGRGNSGISKLVQKLRDLEGLSLACSTSISLFGRKMDRTTWATEIREGPIGDSAFDPPKNYRRVHSPFARMTR